MNNQVLSIKQMQELEELGIDTSKASMCWYGTDEVEFVCFGTDMDKDCGDEICPTFTLQDILEILPSEWTFVKDYCEESDRDPQTYFLFIETGILHDKHGERGYTMLECAFNMLKWCKQNNYI